VIPRTAASLEDGLTDRPGRPERAAAQDSHRGPPVGLVSERGQGVAAYAASTRLILSAGPSYRCALAPGPSQTGCRSPGRGTCGPHISDYCRVFGTAQASGAFHVRAWGSNLAI
jgi:hypothetical protein